MTSSMDVLTVLYDFDILELGWLPLYNMVVQVYIDEGNTLILYIMYSGKEKFHTCIS